MKRETKMGRISHIADYIVLSDDGFELEAGEYHDLDVHLPSDAVVNERAILAFIADPSSSADNLQYKVEIYQRWIDESPHIPPYDSESEQESRVVMTGQFTGGVVRGLWEVIGGGILRLDIPPFQVFGHSPHDRGSYFQHVRFSVKSGGGSVRFKDVVLWFQRKVAGAPSE
jgi:hypothetical protein